MAILPGKSYRDPLPPLTDGQVRRREALREDVTALAEGIGERQLDLPGSLERTADHLEERLRDMGWEPERHCFEVAGRSCCNLLVDPRAPGPPLIVGAHYDTVPGSPGANDNATGVAVLLALAASLRDGPPLPLRLAFFVNEEPPHFHSEAMGSLRYALDRRDAGEHLAGAIALDGLGYFDPHPGSQEYPPPMQMLYPSTADFIAFVANGGSTGLLRRLVGAFRARAAFPSEGAILPEGAPGAGWSDHWSFWQAGYEGVMVTDTLPFRYPHYHAPTDTVDRVDFDRLVRVSDGLIATVRSLAAEGDQGGS